MRAGGALLAALLLPALLAAETPAQSAKAKLDRISELKTRPGEVIVLTPVEINAWLREEVPMAIPKGVRNPHIELGNGTVTGTALVDLLKLREGQNDATNSLLAKLIEGERPLTVSVRLTSSGGKCTVNLTRLDIGGVSAEGSTLDFLIRNFLTPLYPDAKVDQPFDLDYNIDSITVRPDGVRVAIKR